MGECPVLRRLYATRATATAARASTSSREPVAAPSYNQCLPDHATSSSARRTTAAVRLQEKSSARRWPACSASARVSPVRRQRGDRVPPPRGRRRGRRAGRHRPRPRADSWRHSRPPEPRRHRLDQGNPEPLVPGRKGQDRAGPVRGGEPPDVDRPPTPRGRRRGTRASGRDRPRPRDAPVRRAATGPAVPPDAARRPRRRRPAGSSGGAACRRRGRPDRPGRPSPSWRVPLPGNGRLPAGPTSTRSRSETVMAEDVRDGRAP